MDGVTVPGMGAILDVFGILLFAISSVFAFLASFASASVSRVMMHDPQSQYVAGCDPDEENPEHETQGSPTVMKEDPISERTEPCKNVV